MQKICYLADASSPHTKKWCEYFQRRGYEVYVISLNEGQIDNVKVYSFGIDVKAKKNEKIYKKFEYIKLIRKIKKIVYDIKPDILHAHYASSYGFIGSLINYKPYIISVWGTDIYEFPKNGLIQKCIIKYNLKKADYIFSTSLAMATETSKYTNKKIEITPFGIDINKNKIIEEKRKEKKERDYFVIGTIKTLEKRYGMEYLIKAFKIIKDKYKDKKIILKIAGDGHELENLQKLVNNLNLTNDVKFYGRIPQEEVPRMFNDFDIAVFPSLKESFGVSSIESQACGVPVIITNVGGHPETIENKETGIIVNAKSEKEIANAIIKYIENKSILYDMGNKAREFVVKRFEINKVFENVEKKYEEIIKKSK